MRASSESENNYGKAGTEGQRSNWLGATGDAARVTIDTITHDQLHALRLPDKL